MADNRSSSDLLLFMVLFLGVILVVVVFTSSGETTAPALTPTPAPTSSPMAALLVTQPSPGAPETPAATALAPVTNSDQAHTIGEAINLQDRQITLASAEISSAGVLAARFILKNTGSAQIAVSSIISFPAQAADGNALAVEYLNCPQPLLDGKIDPGEQLVGNVCWNNAPAGEVTIRYLYTLGVNLAVWKITPLQSQESAPITPNAATPNPGAATLLPAMLQTLVPTEFQQAVCSCNSGAAYTCNSFITPEQAQACFEYCQALGFGDAVSNLDRNGDGLACNEP